MKKTKVIIPALAMMAVTAAAGISGSVAWFTANRVATVTAGTFAVVSTTSNLSVTTASGVGTNAVDNTSVTPNTHAITTLTNYKLTDASLDHAVVAHSIIAPDITGEIAETATALADANGSITSNPVGNMVRDKDQLVFTAFTWDITFTVAFGNSANFDLGLFLDLSSDETYMHKKINIPQGTAIEGNKYWATPDCSGNKMDAVAAGDNSNVGGTDVYVPEPVETGKAFRIAFIPKEIGGNDDTTVKSSIAYAKVWASNESNAHCGYIDTTLTDSESNAFAAGSSKLSEFDASYAGKTTMLSGYAGSGHATASATTITSGKVLMDSAEKSGSYAAIPANGDKTHADALSQNANYLGMFNVNAGKTVSLTYTCVAWFDGTDTAADGGHIVTGATDFESIVTSMKFGVTNLKKTS